MLGCWVLDAKPLPVSPYSKDKQAKWGYAFEGKARGYKLFAAMDLNGNLADWHIDSMNHAESVVAQEPDPTYGPAGLLAG